MKLRALFYILCLLILPCQLPAQTDAQTRANFERRYAQLPADNARLALRIAANEDEREALTFLYAYMDQADVLDFSPQYFLTNTRLALRTREDMAWGKKVPPREWRHFVLPVRVNNENLDSFRIKLYDTLRERVAGLSMTEAALEINHWCHEHVTYRPSDARTSSPLASLRTATGRCGEESTLTVAALRTVGIPARQVYTPRWAHTDDNHAWVECWTDGRWHFLGACEPAPKLGIAWFNQPASRGMLMSTTVLGEYEGEEQVLRRTPTQTTINVTENYAPTARTTIEVRDAAGRPVTGATVRFGLYNYAEFYSLFQTQTDKDGRAALVSGRGDLVVWASDSTRYGLTKVSAGRQTTPWIVTLNHQAGESFEEDFTLVPPPLNLAAIPQVSAAEEARNNRRLAYEDSLRTAYVSSWPSDSKIGEVAEVLRYDYDRILPLFKKAEGNYLALFDVMARYGKDEPLCLGGWLKPEREFLLDFLETMSDKDLRDFDPAVVDDHFTAFEMLSEGDAATAKQSAAAYERYQRYVLSPRIADEMLSPWRSVAYQYATAEQAAAYRRNPQELVRFLNESVKTLDAPASRYICQSPEATLLFGCADSYSKGLCFVALCRSYGIPARLDPVTQKFQYYAEAQATWQTVSFSTAQEAPRSELSAKLTMAYEPRRFMENPAYYTHFTLSRLEAGLPQLQNYDEGLTWSDLFKGGTPIDCGDYALVSGTRLADGSVLAHLSVFPVKADTTVSLVMREDAEAVSVIGSFNAENTYFDPRQQQQKSLLSTTGRGYYAIGLLRAGDEPSTHILHDIELQRHALEAWGREIVMLFASQEEYDRFQARRNEFPNLPRNLRFGIDSEGNVARDVFGNGLTPSAERPVVLIADTFNRVVFFSQGYTIGLGDQLVKTISKLE
ncbi:MAG: transglutaminase domain-containing protein [Alloprevotella sp.]|nr:transglutaminase domain-containing protein [Alloprevotella sp.]